MIPTKPISPMELLAPAGGPEAGYAALEYGADAVYLGLQKFSARADAENFSLDQVSDLTGYAHSLTRRRRVYVAVNTLILQRELNELIDMLGALSDISVDALIVQDLGVWHIAHHYFPESRLHASTQMAIHSRQGVETAVCLGFARVTLARELTMAEIADASAVRGIETEVFVHGALCYAYSGLCLFSSHALGRSGNRGQCAYLCRDQFMVTASAGHCPVPESSRTGFMFSMKDLALPDYLSKLRQAGVAAVKIEGRKKSPLYVAATVNYYRKLLDGTLTAEEAKTLAADIQTIFSRPWTSLFIQSRNNRQVIDRDRVGHRGTPIGKVETVTSSRSGEACLRFQTNRAIEVHDGLQIDVPGQPRPYGFAVNRFRVISEINTEHKLGGGRSKHRGADDRFRAPAGATVDVVLPADHPHIPKGAVVYCASSQEIKRRYRFARPKSGQFRIRHPVDFRVDIHPHEMTVIASMPLHPPSPGGPVALGLPPSTLRSKATAEDGSRSPASAGALRAGSPLRRAKEGHSQGYFGGGGCHGEAWRQWLRRVPPSSDKDAPSRGRGTAERLHPQAAIEVKMEMRGDFQPVNDTTKMQAAVREAFGKLGATSLAVGSLVIRNPEARFVPVSQLNQIRRWVTEALEQKWNTAIMERTNRIKALMAPPSLHLSPPESLKVVTSSHASLSLRKHAFQWALKTDRIGLLNAFEPEDWSDTDEIIIDISGPLLTELSEQLLRLARRIGRDRLRLALPVITRRWESRALREKVECLRKAGWLKWQVSNLSGWSWLYVSSKLGKAGLTLSADWPVYVTNHAAALQLMEMGIDSLTLSPEDRIENMKGLISKWGLRAMVIVYQDTPLFISESCVGASVKGDCDGRAEDCIPALDLISSFGDKVTVVNRHCRTRVMHVKPFCLASRLDVLAKAGAIRLRADFMMRDYSAEQVRDIWRRLRSGEPVAGGQIANFDRGLE